MKFVKIIVILLTGYQVELKRSAQLQENPPLAHSHLEDKNEVDLG